MRILRHSDPDFSTAMQSLQRNAAPDREVEAVVRNILQTVREKGVRAVLDFVEKFGGPRLHPDQLLVRETVTVEADTEKAITTAHRNVYVFAKKGLRKDWTMKNAQGAIVGERFDPFRRVGIYVPGGTAPLISTAVMTVTLAAAAGVPEIVVATPSDLSGKINPALQFALQHCGATEIYAVGGAQAIAALAFGCETIRPVQKIFGPGNAYVVEAKRQVFGQVAVDLLPGPSEIWVLADASANARWIAADLLAQAEHGKGSAIVFATNSAKLLKSVEMQLSEQLQQLSRKEHLASVMDQNCTLILVKSLPDGVKLANEFAPEHLSLVTKDNDILVKDITTSGAIFLGGYSPVAAGDFLAGPSHTLPTGGGGKSFPGLTADMFQRRTSIIQFDEGSLRKSCATIEAFSRLEGLDAHGKSALIRFEG